MKFRTDINGLRTYAVLAVMIFHFNKDWLPGGFAGVDVFFVISGYLMTSIIFRGIDNNNFSLWKFYSARIRRIIPALLVLIVVLMIFGYLFLAPIPYADLAKHSGGSLLFISNFMYWQEAGYFDASALEKFLLHTWSLSVEWQFYMIYPVALIILAKILSIKALKKALLVGTILTFLFGVYASFKWSTASYFLLSTRVWEMLLGGIVFLYPLQLSKTRCKHALELTGLALVILSFFIISESTVWPGYMALIPTLGAFMLLQANNDKSIFTNNPVVQKIGLWSYSLYLYHWPLLVTYNYLGYKSNLLFYLLITFTLGITSYYIVEKRRWNIRFTLNLLVVSVIITFGISYFTHVNPSKSYLASVYGHSLPDGKRVRMNWENADINSNSTITNNILLTGDSNAAHYSYGISLSENKIPIKLRWKAACFMLYDPNKTSLIYTKYDICKGLEIHDNDFNVIIISQAWDKYLSEVSCPSSGCDVTSLYRDLISIKIKEIILQNPNAQIVVLGQIPIPMPSLVNCFKNKVGFCPDSFEGKVNTVNELNSFIKSLSDIYGFTFIDPNDFLCPDKTRCRYSIDGHSVYADNTHLSAWGAKHVWKYIEDELIKKNILTTY